jgi:hypothetical protein
LAPKEIRDVSFPGSVRGYDAVVVGAGLAAQYADNEQEEHQSVGQPAGAGMHAARHAEEPDTQTGTEPDRRHHPPCRARITVEQQGAENQHRQGVRDKMLPAAVHERRGEYAGEPDPLARANAQRPEIHVEKGRKDLQPPEQQSKDEHRQEGRPQAAAPGWQAGMLRSRLKC